MNFKLRKCEVVEESVRFNYLVKDVFNGDIVQMSLTGRDRIKSVSFVQGDIVYVLVSPYEMNRGRIFSEKSDFRDDYYNDVMKQKAELDTVRHEDDRKNK